MSTQHASIIRFQVKSKAIKENTEPKNKTKTNWHPFMIENTDKTTQSQERTMAGAVTTDNNYMIGLSWKQPEH